MELQLKSQGNYYLLKVKTLNLSKKQTHKEMKGGGREEIKRASFIR